MYQWVCHSFLAQLVFCGIGLKEKDLEKAAFVPVTAETQYNSGWRLPKSYTENVLTKSDLVNRFRDIDSINDILHISLDNSNGNAANNDNQQ
ncbi:hypothetical protein Spico_1441 [Parasphaerochaeta coccoides DSM 17374]|uniref:Uncharacterized protein n=1 Tax=Parasphaerochaeta coccoides (strain ATCC BAA-1237 / DSM 17374 / SPN1) TaxID=760011 RepID=F4GI47_PARC1|nr:hypothetical protein Spico_1441 [Parasphaerochaeta coccoides DSM 17374]